MLLKIGRALLIALIVGFLLAVILGPVLLLIGAPPTDFIGKILKECGWAIGIVAGLWYFFFGGVTWPGFGNREG